MFRKLVATLLSLSMLTLLVFSSAAAQDRKLLLGAGSNGGGSGPVCNGTLCFDGTPVAVADSEGTSPLEFSYTVSANSNRVMFISVFHDSEQVTTTANVTFNGDEAQFVNGQTNPSGHGRVELYKLDAPDAGEFTVSISWTGTGTIIGGVVSFYGASTTISGPVLSSGTDDSVESDTLTSAANEIALDFVQIGVGDPAETATPGAGQTARFNEAVPNSTRAASSYKTGTTSTTTSWTISAATGGWACILVGVQPAA
jgi:hypothetical protein